MCKNAVAVAVLGSLLSACVFEVRQACEDGGGCGVGETCVIRSGKEVCRCGSAESVGAPVCPSPQECVAQSRCNAPPVAVIGDGSATMKVGAHSLIAIPAVNSWDPDGDALDHTWTLVGECFTEISSDSGTELRFVTAEPDTECTVELTADDGVQQDTVAAQVSVTNVGSHVSSAAPCAAGDTSIMADKGTAGNPWCTLEDGLAAAAAFWLVEVRVDTSVQQAAGIQIPDGVTVLGGFTRQADHWPRDAVSEKTPLILDSPTDYDPNGVSLVGRGAGLAGLTIYRRAACSSDCAAVTITGANATISDCLIGGDADHGLRLSAQGNTAVALRVHGDAGAAEVAVERTTVLVPATAAVAYGIELDGTGAELHATLAEVTVDGTGSLASMLGPFEEVAGIRTFGLSSLDATNVYVSLNSIQATRGYAIADGRLAVDVYGDGRGSQGSKAWSLTGVSASVDAPAGIQTAVGIALFGTSSANITAGSGSATVGLAGHGSSLGVGLWTVDTTDVVLAGQDNQASAAHLSGTVDIPDSAGQSAPPVATGILDGVVPEEITPGLQIPDGSTGLTIKRAWTSGSIPDATGVGSSGVVTGAWLLGTRGGSFEQVTFEATGAGGVERVSGLWTLRTYDVAVSSSSFGGTVGQLGAGNEAVTCLADGLYNSRGSHDLELGSTALQLVGSVADSLLQLADPGAPGAAAAGVLLVGSERARIGGLAEGEPNTLEPMPQIGGDVTAIWTIATTNSDITGNVIGPHDSLSHDGNTRTRLVGVRDGDAGAADVARSQMASSSLAIEANRIYGGYNSNYESTIGVWLDHHAEHGANGSVDVENNAILGFADGETVGILAANANTDVVNNTIHCVWCPTNAATPVCHTEPHVATGIEVTGGRGRKVKLANNIVLDGIVPDDPYARVRLIVDHGGSLGGELDLSPSLAVFASNLLAGEPFSTYDAYCVVDSHGEPHCLDGANIASALEKLSAKSGELFRSYSGSVTLCGDGVHLGNADAVGDMANPSYLPQRDIDGENRSEPHDIGADEVGSSDPICPL